MQHVWFSQWFCIINVCLTNIRSMHLSKLEYNKIHLHLWKIIMKWYCIITQTCICNNTSNRNRMPKVILIKYKLWSMVWHTLLNSVPNTTKGTSCRLSLFWDNGQSRVQNIKKIKGKTDFVTVLFRKVSFQFVWIWYHWKAC